MKTKFPSLNSLTLQIAEKRLALDKLGMTLVTDGWKDHAKRPLTNYIVANKDHRIFLGADNNQG